MLNTWPRLPHVRNFYNANHTLVLLTTENCMTTIKMIKPRLQIYKSTRLIPYLLTRLNMFFDKFITLKLLPKSLKFVFGRMQEIPCWQCFSLLHNNRYIFLHACTEIESSQSRVKINPG